MQEKSMELSRLFQARDAIRPSVIRACLDSVIARVLQRLPVGSLQL